MRSAPATVRHRGNLVARLVRGTRWSWRAEAHARSLPADLDAAGLREGARDGPAAQLHRGEPAAGRCRRKHRRDRVVPLQPQHLLDQVGGLGQVRAPRRRRRDDDAVAARPRSAVVPRAAAATGRRRPGRRLVACLPRRGGCRWVCGVPALGGGTTHGAVIRCWVEEAARPPAARR